MKFKLIKTEEEYNKVMSRIENIGDDPKFETDQELIDEFELLSALVAMFDKEHFFVSSGDPIEIIKLKMDYMNLTRKDLSHIASSGVLSEIFNRKRALSKQMIREFAKLLDIDQGLLNTPYLLKDSQSATMAKVRTAPSKKVMKPHPVKHSLSRFSFIGGHAEQIAKFKKRISTNCMLFNVCTT